MMQAECLQAAQALIESERHECTWGARLNSYELEFEYACVFSQACMRLCLVSCLNRSEWAFQTAGREGRCVLLGVWACMPMCLRTTERKVITWVCVSFVTACLCCSRCEAFAWHMGGVAGQWQTLCVDVSAFVLLTSHKAGNPSRTRMFHPNIRRPQSSSLTHTRTHTSLHVKQRGLRDCVHIADAWSYSSH